MLIAIMQKSKESKKVTSKVMSKEQAHKKIDKQSKVLKKPSKKMTQLNKKTVSSKGVTTPKLPDHHFKVVKVKRGLAGLGLFAGEHIKKGEMIIEYIGNILNKEEAEKKTVSQYLFEINPNRTIDGSPRWNIARYANHSCDGNAESDVKKGRVFVKAIKHIQEGEEIVYDYGEEFVKEYIAPYGCNCVSGKHLYGLKGAGV
jgi:SET domain-containing protein